ncbi:MAG TPA: hypothetical protein HA362_05020 [Nanoarchaeota archaeon]|nr:hypothetical protein [Nanoarchaeota archaeon]
MPALLDKVIRDINGEFFDNPSLHTALAKAQEYAGSTGYVASLFHILHGRVIAPFENEIWTTDIITSITEDDVGVDKHGKFAEKGQPVVITVHGGGILSSPDRLNKANREVLTNHSAAKLTKKEITDLLHGVIRDDTEIKVFGYNEFLEESALPEFLQNYPRFAVVRTLEQAVQTKSGMQSLDELNLNSQFIIYAAGKKPAVDYFARAKARYKHPKVGVWHLFDEMNPEYPQGGFVSVHSKGDRGINCQPFFRDPGVIIGVRLDSPKPQIELVPEKPPLEKDVQAALDAQQPFIDRGLVYMPFRYDGTILVPVEPKGRK